MPRRTASIAAALSVLMIGATLISGCGTQNNNTEVVCNTAADLSSEDALALNEEIAELTIKQLAPNAKIIYQNSEKGWVGDIPRFSYSIEKLRSLGWIPQLSSKQAIKDFCQYYVSNPCSEWNKPAPGTGVDIYLKKNNTHYLFDTKTVKPNVSGLKSFLPSFENKECLVFLVILMMEFFWVLLQVYLQMKL